MSKTAKKKIAKKPRVFRSVDEVKKAHFPKKYAEDMKALNDKVDLLDSRLRTLNAWETMQDAMSESRSAPAEEEKWIPKERELVVPISKSANGNDDTGWVMPVQEDDESPHDYRFRVHLDDAEDEYENRWYRLQDLRPATEAEVAEHKAKEEQRAKELAKPLEFGMKVRTTQGDGFVHGVYGDGCTHPTGRWWIAFPHNVLNHYARKDITIID